MISFLIEAALRALAAALLVGAGIWLLKVRNVVAQKVAWVMALGAALLMPLVMHNQILPSVVMPTIFAGKPAPSPKVQAPVITHAILSEPLRKSNAIAAHADEPITGATRTESIKPAPSQGQISRRRSFSFLLAAEAIYFVVLAALLLRLLLGSLAAWRLWFCASPVSEEVLPLLPDGRKSLNVRASSRIHSPVTVGVGIVLPANFSSWPHEKLCVVLAHEESHVRQFDFFLQLAARAHAAAFWFSPLGWWLKQKLTELSETISDGAALAAAADASTYAQVLLDFASEPRPLFAGVAMARTSNLSIRIDRLLNETQFKSAFAEGRIRMYLAGVLVPLAMTVVTLHVQAASQQNTVANTQDPLSTIQSQLTAPLAENQPELHQQLALISPDQLHTADNTFTADSLFTADNLFAPAGDQYDSQTDKKRAVFNYSIDSEGDSWALIEGNQSDANLMLGEHSGPAAHEQFEKARKMANGDFFWFTRNGKSYVVDDPATIKELDGLLANPHPMVITPDANQQLETFAFTKDGKDGELVLTSPGGKNKKIIIRDKDLNVNVNVDVEKQLAAVQEALKKIEVKLSKDEIANLDAKMADLQVKLSKIQTNVNLDVSADVEAAMKNLDKVGSNIQIQTDLKVLDDDQIKSIIDEALKNGKARPVE